MNSLDLTVRLQRKVRSCLFVPFAHGNALESPHRISRRLTARLLRLPLKGGVIAMSNVVRRSLQSIWLRLNKAKPR